jgi:hypothetical protein
VSSKCRETQGSPPPGTKGLVEQTWAQSNKRMQLTKLRAAPALRAEVPPCAPAGALGGGTASQLIRGGGPTLVERGEA